MKKNPFGQSDGDSADVIIEWGLSIPMRDGTTLAGTLYRPRSDDAVLPAIATITPYIADSFHEAGVFFASSGFLFLSVDCRGRGNSGGVFVTYEHDGRDGYDVVEWLAQNPHCNGKVAMGGGSYSGFNQWATAMHTPPHLCAIMPRCASYPGLDFPIRNNIGEQYTLQWLAFIAGRTLQPNLFRDQRYWSQLWCERFKNGASYASLADHFPATANELARWTRHPEPDAYWDQFTPQQTDYAIMAFPVLTVTGYYDDDQHGALAYYRAAEQSGSAEFQKSNYLILGPWDHQGVGAPSAELDGIDLGSECVIDLRALGADYYRWTLDGGERPAFLQDRVTYFVVGANCWRSAPNLDAVTAKLQPLYLGGQQPRFSQPGELCDAVDSQARDHRYAYDPLDVSTADLETEILPYNISDIRMLEANDGKQLVYDSAPFERDVEVTGFFRLAAWIGIDQPDTDFRALIYLVEQDGRHVLLTNDTIRARYRNHLRESELLTSDEPKLYSFDSFWFTSRLVKAGERIRLVLGPFNSIYTQKNYNSGNVVAFESRADARTVTASIAVSADYASVLYIPVGAP
jgi:putative CocE/NonD family hydrolase